MGCTQKFIIGFIILLFSLTVYAEDLSKDKLKLDYARERVWENGRRTIEIRATKGITVNGSANDISGRYIERKATMNIVPSSANLGKTMLRRIILSRGNAALLGVTALSLALKGDGFLIDEVDGKIYYPQKTSNSSYSLDSFNWFDSPFFACNHSHGVRPDESTYKDSPPNIFLCYTYEDYLNSIYKHGTGKTIGTEPKKLAEGKLDHADYLTGTYYDGYIDKVQWSVFTSRVKNESSQSQRELTEKDLGDYMLGNLPNYERPNWISVLDAFTPIDEYEEKNNPNYKTIVDNFVPDSNDTVVNPRPNEDPTNPNSSGFDLPNFCDWATYICDFVDWIKQDDIEKNTEIDVNEEPIQSIDTTVKFNGQCPVPLTYDFNYGGQSQSFGIKDFTPFCSMLNDILKPIVIAVSSFVAVLIIGGVRTDE